MISEATFWLSDEERSRVEALLPKGQRGARRVDDRRVISGQGLGWEFAHVCVDDASRIAFAAMKDDEKAASAADFLRMAVAYYRSLVIEASASPSPAS